MPDQAGEAQARQEDQEPSWTMMGAILGVQALVDNVIVETVHDAAA